MRPDVIHVEEGQRLAGVHPGYVEDLLVAQFDLSRDGHGVEAKAQRPGDQIARLAVFADEGVILAADPGAIISDRPDEQQAEAEAEAGKSQELDETAPPVVALTMSLAEPILWRSSGA